jgi:hypothetical protein
MNEEQPNLLKDKDWRVVADEVCRVEEFRPLAGRIRGNTVESAEDHTPYATVKLISPRIRGTATGFITHKTDFHMLWNAFHSPVDIPAVHREVRGPQPEDQEVWLVWTQKRYRPGLGIMKWGLPKLIVMICARGSYDLLTNRAVRPELTGMARHLALRPLVTWTPEVMVR